MANIPLSRTHAAGEGCDRIRLVVDNAGAQPRYATSDETTAHCFIFYSMLLNKAVVVMVDGHHGSSITNAADWLTSFVYRLHLGRRGISLNNTRWVYQDSEGRWDELVVKPVPDTVTMTEVAFRPLASGSFDDAMATLIEVGVHPAVGDYDAILEARAAAGLPK